MDEHVFLNDMAIKEMDEVRMEIEQIQTLEDRVDSGFEYLWQKLVSIEYGREGMGSDGGGTDESMGNGMDPEFEGGSSQSSASSSENRQALDLLDESFRNSFDESFKMPQIK